MCERKIGGICEGGCILPCSFILVVERGPPWLPGSALKSPRIMMLDKGGSGDLEGVLYQEFYIRSSDDWKQTIILLGDGGFG